MSGINSIVSSMVKSEYENNMLLPKINMALIEKSNDMMNNLVSSTMDSFETNSLSEGRMSKPEAAADMPNEIPGGRTIFPGEVGYLMDYYA